MSLDSTFFRYLDHFGRANSIRELWSRSSTPGVGLRHDIDHDLDIALEVGFWEERRGIRATYFVLPTARYWDDPRLLDKCLQLQDFGHEVGLHCDVLSEWFAGDIDDVKARLASLLEYLRSAGVEVTGISPHGARACYERGFINYWCFEELRPTDPQAREDGLSAEGVSDPDPRFHIAYPPSHRLVRDDGSSFDLWSISMGDLGLEYDAVHVDHDHYYTDSGGDWTRSVDPLSASFATGRHQVLMHPLYWRGDQRIYFFLSTARSGTKWLSRVLNDASSTTSRHEFTVNHRYIDGALVPEKRTAEDFTDLLEDAQGQRDLMIQARSWIEDLGTDYAECNVYLVHLLATVRQVFPDATLIHLHRKPREVVRSILERDWYDTPEDDRHPRIEVPEWDEMTQLEKACWYVRATNEALLDNSSVRLSFEGMVDDPGYLTEALAEVGIAFYPRLAVRSFGEPLNVGAVDQVPPYEDWPAEWKETFERICGPIRKRLDYARPESAPDVEQSRVDDHPRRGEPEILVATTSFERSTTVGCTIDRSRDGHVVVPEGGRHAHVVLGGASWRSGHEPQGWPADVGAYFSGHLDAEVGDGSVYLTCLMYGPDGAQIAQRRLRRLKPLVSDHPFSFRTRVAAARFDVALYMPMDDLPNRLVLKELRLQKIPFLDTLAAQRVRGS